MGTLLLRTESVASSKIEQIQANVDDYARALHGVRANSSAIAMAAATTALQAMIATVGPKAPIRPFRNHLGARSTHARRPTGVCRRR
jgi:hypothetical protein